MFSREDSTRTQTPNLPSWVPDYSVAMKPYPLKYRGAVQTKLWKAAGKLSWVPDIAAMKKGLLPVQGYCLDVVDHTSIMREESKDPVAPWASIVRLAFGLDDYYRRSRPKYRQLSRVRMIPAQRLCPIFSIFEKDAQTKHRSVCFKVFLSLRKGPFKKLKTSPKYTNSAVLFQKPLNRHSNLDGSETLPEIARHKI